MTVGIDTRRADIVAAITAALSSASIAGVPVCDDEPDTLAADRSIVVTWVSSRYDGVQWLHTYEVLVIPTNRSAEAFFTGRDELVGIVLATLNNLAGVDRPTATTRTVTIGAGERSQDYPLCGVVTTTATAQPTSQ